MLLEIWKAFEEKYGTAEDVVKVQGMMPITSKRRIVDKETGQTVEGTSSLVLSRFLVLLLTRSPIDWDMVFADDERESNPTSFKFLQMAHAWKASQAKVGGNIASTSTVSSFVPSSGKERGEDGSSDVASSNGGDD